MGTIWLATASGVNSYDGKKFTTYATKTINPTLEWNKTSGDLWFNAGEKTEYIVLMAKDELLNFPKPITKNIGNSFGVTHLSKDKTVLCG
jgi:hypothetical protein